MDADEDELLGIEGIEEDEDDEVLGIDGIEDEDDEDELLGMDGAEDEDEDEEGEELGIDGMPLLELCCCCDWQPARISASADALIKVAMARAGKRSALFMEASVSLERVCDPEVPPAALA